MATENILKNEVFEKLQADVDGILEGIDHIFDDIAEYTQESDPINIIDLDKVLTMEIPKTRIYNSSFKRQPEPLYKRQAQKWNFPAQPKKVIRAMPRKLQEEVRIYEYRTGGTEKKKIGKAMNLLFKRID
jgi:hypothetical protein